ncbi:MAG: hypothetical protein QXU63_01970 [Nitrososphaerota archaeon]
MNFEYYEILREPVIKKGSMYETFDEWSELVLVVIKLLKDEVLNERDKMWLKETSDAIDWSLEDVIDELKNIERSEREG